MNHTEEPNSNDEEAEEYRLSLSSFGWPLYIAVVLGAFILITAAILLALPVRDADLWWQMAQGRYLLDEGTLSVDQTAFSWTPAHGSKTLATVYCAWIGQISLHLLYLAGGLPLLYAFRYFCFFLFFAIIACFAWRRGLWKHPLTWLACLVAFLMSHSAAGYLKPEILSFVYMTFAIALWLGIKTSTREPWEWCYAFPVLILIWVNTHGGFLVGMGFLVLMAMGETANALYSPHMALPKRVRKHLFIAIMACFPMTLITPYGSMYIKETILGQLIGYEGDEKTIGAYLSIFTEVGKQMHLIEYLIISGGMVLSALIPQLIKKRIDFALLLTYSAFTVLYTVYLRTTYFGGIAFVFTFLYLLTQKDSWLWTRPRHACAALMGIIGLVTAYHGLTDLYERVTLAGLLKESRSILSYIDYYKTSGAEHLTHDMVYLLVFTLAFAFVCFLFKASREWLNVRQAHVVLTFITYCLIVYLARQSIYDRIYKPRGSDWLGFGIGYYNAVEETDYIKDYLPETKQVGNDYVSGGYLMWRLYPQTKVMIDPRHFPFHSWYREYRAFVTGHNIPGFLQKYPCDVWCINFRYKSPIDWFTASKEYKLAFYGARAAIFVKTHVKLPDGAPTRGKELPNIRSLGRALSVLKFTLNNNDWEGALQVLEGMDQNFVFPEDRIQVTASEDFVFGVLAFVQRNYEEAAKRLKAAKDSKVIWSDSILLKSYIQLTRQQWNNKQEEDALKSAQAALDLAPNGLIPLYNAGVIDWYIQNIKEDVHVEDIKFDSKWKTHLQAFVPAATKNTNIPREIIQVSQEIISETYKKRPPLIYENEPAQAMADQLEQFLKDRE